MGFERLDHQIQRLRTRTAVLGASFDGVDGPAGGQWLREALAWLDSAMSELREIEGRIELKRLTSESETWRFKAFFDQAPLGFLVTDLEGIVLEANQEAADLLGESVLGLLGASIRPHLTDRGQRLEEISSAVRDGNGSGVRLRLRCADRATEINADVAVRPDHGDEPTELHWFLGRPEPSPIPPSRRPAADATDGALAAHELRSSLSAILNSALLLSLTSDGDERARSSHETIVRQAAYIRRLIEGLAPPTGEDGPRG